MPIKKITYRTNRAKAKQIQEHLKACDCDYTPKLSGRVAIKDFSEKIYDKAVTFEAWDNKKLVGLVAAYFNDMKNQMGYITDVSVICRYSGKGIATKLMVKCIKCARKRKFTEIKLEVHPGSKGARKLYKKFGFKISSRKKGVLKMRLKIKQGRQ